MGLGGTGDVFKFHPCYIGVNYEIA